jgi:hypothetical protein
MTLDEIIQDIHGLDVVVASIGATLTTLEGPIIFADEVILDGWEFI